MRILHFSDFHLNGDKIDKAEAILEYMMDALKLIKQEQKIDIVLFSGDILEQGGKGFVNLKDGFQKFHEVVITPLMSCLELPESHFIFTPGNHDIDRGADSERMERNLEDEAKTIPGIIGLTEASDVKDYTKRIDAFKSFEFDYYSAFKDMKYNPNRFASTFEMNIDGLSVGIASLNTVWRCGFDDANKIALGLNQITEQSSKIKNCQLTIALTHYPIGFLKEVERVEVAQKSAHTFDMFFCGHSHSGYIDFRTPYRNECFLEVNSSGSLAANIYSQQDKYKNSFQIIDCEPKISYVVQTYVQHYYQEFELERKDFPDGKNVKMIPDAAKLKSLYEQHEQILSEKNEELKRNQIFPFQKIQDYINSPKATFMKSAFVSCDGIKKCMDQLRNNSGNCRLMALSGMGKTRIILETFKDIEGVFYSDSSNCITGLIGLLRNFSPKVVIIDNCNEKCMGNAIKYIDESGAHVRLITIYNVMTPEEKATNGNLLELTFSETTEVVDKMIESANIPVSVYDVPQAIRERSCKIPGMALLMIDAYKSTKKLDIENSDVVLSTILRGDKELSVQSMDVLRAISLFEPLGKDNNVRDEYDYVRTHCSIHNVNLQQDIVDNEFINTIQDFEQRQLIEHDGSCIRLRPRPLAEWLTESWLKKYGNKLADIVDDINHQEDNLKERLLRAFAKRIKDMTPSKYTKNLFDELNNPEKGAFHNERIAFSKAGSQLFLSMGLVSPVMVAKNLYSLLNEKNIEWLKDKFDKDVRRNIVWSLENICHSDEAFDDAAKCLAMLAAAENEDIANNATGQFVQLFHLYLSGTKANLKQRISLLKSLRLDKVYLPLLLKAIDNAFMTGHFYRSNTNGLPDAADDYQPKYAEVHFYWRDCVEVLKGIVEQNEEILEVVKEIIPKHVSDFVRLGANDILFDMLDFIGEKCNYDWMAIRDSLARYLDYWFQGSDESRVDFQAMLYKFAPKTFYDKLSAFVKDNHCRVGDDYAAYAHLLTERAKPLAEEFLENRIFEEEDFKKILKDKELNRIWFLRALAQLTKSNDSQYGVFLGILKCVLSFPKDYVDSFIPTYIRIIGKNEIVQSFFNEIENAGYYNLAASILGVLDDKAFHGLASLIIACNSGKCEDDVINQYLKMYNYEGIDDIFDIFELLRDGGINEKTVGYPFLLDHFNYMNVNELKQKGCFERYKKLLLDFDFKESTRFLNRQITDAVEQILKETDDVNLALRFHHRIMQVLGDMDYIDNPFGDIYFTLLPKYQNIVLEDLLSKLGSSDTYLAYRISLYLHLGSGLGSGTGPLFQCDNEKLKEACFKYPHNLPARLANLCPVYEYSSEGKQDSFSNIFLWLCDNFGNQKQMLDEFSTNMGTFSWVGVDGFSDFIAQQIPCVTPLLTHQNPTVREWAKTQLDELRNEVLRQQGQEAYEKMING